MYSISACRTPREKKLFERLPEALLKTDPAFIPPFPGSVAKYLSPNSAFCRRHGEILPFIAWRDGVPVGRIAAIISRSHNDYHQDRVGFFGFFECENNPETAALLFQKVEEVLRERNLTSMRGPYNPSINDDCGLLVQGYEIPPVIGMMWNPPYYQDLLTGQGLKAVRSLFGFLLPMHRLEVPSRLTRIMNYLEKRAGSKVAVRPIKLAKLTEELEIIHEVYNATLQRNWGFVPISMDDLLGAADDIRAIADPELLLIGEINGQNAGVAITLPNFNEILARVKKTPHWLRLPHILWLMKTHRVDSCRQTVLGVSPRFRDRGGLHARLLYTQFTLAKKRHANAALGWVEENNREIIENCLMMGGIHDRTWAIFEKPIPAAA